MTFINAILQGIVQGVTEFLPISSSGHLSLFQHFTGVSGEGSLLFTVLLHLGTLVAVFLVYYKTIAALVIELFQMIGDIFTGKFKWKAMSHNRRMLVMLIISCLPLILLVVPVGGKSLKDVLAPLSEDNDIMVEGFCFLFTSCLLFFATWASKNQKSRPLVHTRQAVTIGFAQLLAAGFPGISRSGSTISAGMVCGVEKEYMVRYSFILGIPAILAANIFEVSDAVHTGEKLSIGIALAGILTALIVGIIAIKVLEWLVKKDKLYIFAIYCLALGVLVIAEGLFEKMAGQTVFQAIGIQ